jgi:hypothetical protein
VAGVGCASRMWRPARPVGARSAPVASDAAIWRVRKAINDILERNESQRLLTQTDAQYLLWIRRSGLHFGRRRCTGYIRSAVPGMNAAPLSDARDLWRTANGPVFLSGGAAIPYTDARRGKQICSNDGATDPRLDRGLRRTVLQTAMRADRVSGEDESRLAAHRTERTPSGPSLSTPPLVLGIAPSAASRLQPLAGNAAVGALLDPQWPLLSSFHSGWDASGAMARADCHAKPDVLPGDTAGALPCGPSTLTAQRMLVDGKGKEINVNLDGVKPGTELAPTFPDTAEEKLKADTTEIVNAMLKTPKGIEAVRSWVDNESLKVRLELTDELIKQEGRYSHGISYPPRKGITRVKISTAIHEDVDSEGGKAPERYKYLSGQQYIGAVGVHESRHQTPENMELGADETKDREAEVDPISNELIVLIQYDILYPADAGYWRSEAFEGWLTKTDPNLYRKIVTKTVTELLVGDDPATVNKREAALDTYLSHEKVRPAGK